MPCPATLGAPAEGMVAQSPVQCLLCSQVPVGGLRGPRLTPSAGERSLSFAAIAEPAAVVAARLSVWGERRLPAARG